MDVAASYFVVTTFFGISHFEIPNRRDLFEMCILLNMSDEGFKMIDGKIPQFNTFNKGTNFINTLFTYFIGFSIEKNSVDLKYQVSLLTDIQTSTLVLVCSALFAFIVGILISLLLSKVESIRSTSVSEIMFIIFGTYLLSSIAFLNHKWDYVSEEVSVLIFGIFCSHFTRYNMSFQSAGRFR